MSQISFADAEQAGKRKKKRHDVFLAEIALVVSWKGLRKVIESHYRGCGSWTAAVCAGSDVVGAPPDAELVRIVRPGDGGDPV